MTYSSKTPCPDRVLPSTTVWFFQRETKQSLHTPHFTLHSSHSKLETSHSTLHTSHFTVHTVAAFMQPLQYDLRTPAAKDNSIAHAATAWSNLHAAITMRSAETELQNTRELRATASEIVAQNRISTPERKKTLLKHFLKGLLEGKSLAPKWRKSADKSLWQPPCSHSNTIYEVQLQKTIVLRMQPQHEATLTQPLQCELQNTIELRATASEITRRSSRFGDELCIEK